METEAKLVGPEWVHGLNVRIDERAVLEWESSDPAFYLRIWGEDLLNRTIRGLRQAENYFLQNITEPKPELKVLVSEEDLVNLRQEAANAWIWQRLEVSLAKEGLARVDRIMGREVVTAKGKDSYREYLPETEEEGLNLDRELGL